MSNIHRPTFIGIHARDESTQVLYISSGCRQAMGYTPAQVMAGRARDFIADPYNGDYPQIYESKVNGEETDEDEANAYVMYMNLKNTNGTPVLHRVTTFKCDNCVIVVAVAFPEVPFQGRHELEVQMLDGAMKRLNITRQKEQEEADVQRRREEAAQGRRVPLYYAPSRQIKVAFVLENPEVAEASTEAGRRQNGPLIVFVTGSVSRLIDADTSDLLRFPFLKLVAPEDVLKASVFFDQLADSPDVLFETFSLLSRPPVMEGDVVVPDTQNSRILVECLGANVQDGVALLLRKLKTVPPPTRDSVGNYIRKTKVHEVDEDGGYLSLSEMISSDPESSSVPEMWSRLR
ncbi:hypothetical protein H4R99_001262 [Coemansia sp. RSA 1722]|nr:hypothetical protein LPJ57_000656 [Coemansia sp. RSA 486]KAJ2236537.1 hypothetical protein IWW45_001705 [Coemansia sp. RSA 485]KAJ2600411.1 hypothetical protein GGF39_001792 [Coemansia sp. RSA 1721]KAJ2605282.1 hypothetical protein H4R99_001262 [Coemansia sp. RSA 1722]KAJ2639286.1 hypothetical protein GGF40_000951 [Coemansia sp. RSA 1286]